VAQTSVDLNTFGRWPKQREQQIVGGSDARQTIMPARNHLLTFPDTPLSPSAQGTGEVLLSYELKEAPT
jgi:hypothetical protein